MDVVNVKKSPDHELSDTRPRSQLDSSSPYKKSNQTSAGKKGYLLIISLMYITVQGLLSYVLVSTKEVAAVL